MEEVIPTLVDETTNNLLTMILSKDEVKNVVFTLNKDGAEPDGFGACFFQIYWDIVQNDVYNAVV